MIRSYGIDTNVHAAFITSDTTNSARVVSTFFDEAEQVDCTMHRLNLALLYGFGLRENTRTDRATGVVSYVTPGSAGPFHDGTRLIKGLRSLAKYFGTGQRLEHLRAIQKNNHLPIGRPMIDGTTRVSSCNKLMGTSILHYWALKRYFMLYEDDLDFKRIWESLSDDDWKSIVEMEAVSSKLAKYAVAEAQMDCFTSAVVIFYRFVCEQFLKRNNFYGLPLERFQKGTILRDIKRIHIPVEDFTANGSWCLDRLRAQMSLRFDSISASEAFQLFLDPWTCFDGAANFLIKDEATYRMAMKTFKEKHREVYHRIIISQKRDEVAEAETQNPNACDADDNVSILSDDFDLIITPTQSSMATEADLESQADLIVDQWMKSTVEWKSFIKADLKPEKCTFNSLFGRICNVDAMRWFREQGQYLFPSISLLARIHLAKMDSSGFQERVFSSATGAMNSHQTCMSFNLHELRTLLFQNQEFIQYI